MLALVGGKLLQVIESAEPPDAKTLRDCVAVLKELTALTRDLAPDDEKRETGVIVLPPKSEEA